MSSAAAFLPRGRFASAFRPVFDEFANFFQAGEVGASLAVIWKGKLVVDLWGGIASRETQAPWQEDTLVNVFSCSKGVTNMCMWKLVEKGQLSLNERVSRIWPEFGANGKENITVSQLLSHQGGVAALEDPVALSALSEIQAGGPSSPLYQSFLSRLASQPPNWILSNNNNNDNNDKQSDTFGYHAFTVGFFAAEILRRVDPEHRTIRRFFAEEFGLQSPSKIDFHFGIGQGTASQPSLLMERMAKMYNLPLDKVSGLSKEFESAAVNPKSLTARTFGSLREFSPWRYRELEVPSAVGFATARALAQLYAAMSSKSGNVLVLNGETPSSLQPLFSSSLEERKIAALDVAVSGMDQVLLQESQFSVCGFAHDRPLELPTAFGHLGMGGALGLGDFGFGEEGLGIGFATSGLHVNGNYERRDRLVDAIYACIKKEKGLSAKL